MWDQQQKDRGEGASDRSQHRPWGPGRASLGKQRPGGAGGGQVSRGWSSRRGTEDAAFEDKVRQGQLVCGDDQRMPGAERTDPVGQGKNFDL